jgi:hypothetical protein
MFGVFLEIPVWRRGHDQLDVLFMSEFMHPTAVTEINMVNRMKNARLLCPSPALGGEFRFDA